MFLIIEVISSNIKQKAEQVKKKSNYLNLDLIGFLISDL